LQPAADPMTRRAIELSNARHSVVDAMLPFNDFDGLAAPIREVERMAKAKERQLGGASTDAVRQRANAKVKAEQAESSALELAAMVAVCTGAVRETGISTASGPEAGASGSPRQLPPPSSGAYGGALWSSGTRMPRSPRVAPAPRVLTNVASPRQARMRSYEESPLTSSLPMPMAAPLARPKLASRPMTARSADRGAAVQAALPRPSSEQSARRRGAQTSRASRRTLASVPMSAPPTAQRAAAVSAAGDGTAGGGDAQRKAFLAHESLCCGGLPMMHADGRTYIWPEDLSWLGPLAPPDPAEP